MLKPQPLTPMKREQPSPVDREAWEMEDRYIEGKTRMMTGFFEGACAMKQFVKENPDKPFIMTLSDKEGHKMQVDVTDSLSMLFYQLSFQNYKLLTDANMKLEADAHVAGVKAKWGVRTEKHE